MKIKELFEKNRQNWLQEQEIVVNNGKLDSHPASKIFLFAPLAVVVSCLIVILAVFGIPKSMDVFKQALDSVYGSHQDLKPAAEELLFEDVKVDSPYYDALAYLKKHGVISGYQDNTFKPEQPLKRAELLKIIINAKKQYPLALNYNSCFADVNNEWYAPAVCFGKEKGWIASDNNKFRPEEILTRAEALKILLNAFEVKRGDVVLEEKFDDVAEDSWYKDYVETAQTKGLLNDKPGLDLFRGEAEALRGDTVQILFRIMQL